MLDLEREFAIFLHSVLMGMILLAIYFCFETLRHLFPHKRWMINIEDICYWCMVSVYVFVQLYYTNNGKIRWFSILGVVSGAVFLWKILAVLQKIVEKIYVFVCRKFRKKP